MTHPQIEQFLETLSAAWPRDANREAALEELRDHLLSAVEEAAADGDDEQQALARALAECGPPVQLARQYRGAFYERRKRWIMRLSTAGLAASVLAAIGVAVWWPGENGSPIVAKVQAQASGTGDAAGGTGTATAVQKQPSVEENNAATQQKLAQGVKQIDFNEAPMMGVFKFFADRHAVQFYLNRAALEQGGVNVDNVNVTLQLKDVRLETALDLALQQAGGDLDYYLRDGVIMITTKESMENASEVRAYPVADLLKMHTPSVRQAGGLGGGYGGGGFGGGGMGGVGGGFFGSTDGQVEGAMDEYFVQFGGDGAAAPAGGGQAGVGAGGPGGMMGSMGGVGISSGGWHASTAEDDLIRVIQQSVAPESWSDNGGSGTITYFGGMLVIRQSARAHREVEKVLSLLRETAQNMPRPAAGLSGGGAKENQLKIFSLMNARANEAARIVTGLMEIDSPDLRLSVDERTNAIIARGRTETLAVIEALLMRLDQKAETKPTGAAAEAAGRVDFTVFYLKFATAAAAVERLKERHPKATIQADVRLNAVYVRNDDPAVLDDVTKFLKTLDQKVPPAGDNSNPFGGSPSTGTSPPRDPAVTPRAPRTEGGLDPFADPGPKSVPLPARNDPTVAPAATPPTPPVEKDPFGA
jgi:hypothetical protein